MMFGAVEDQKFFVMILGLPDPDKLLSSNEALKDAIRAHTERSDFKFKHIHYVSDYR